jgi:hypothetical protein
MVELRIQDLLVGHQYRSYKRNFVGRIIEAKVFDEYENTYRVRIRENDYPTYHYAIVKVEVD